MCRFSVQNAVPAEPASPGLEQLLENDSFDWFECLDDLPEDQLTSMVLPAAAARDSDSTAGSEGMPAQPEMGVASTAAPCASGNSDGSSYDLMAMFKQQIEQDPTTLLRTAVQAPYGYAAFGAPEAVPGPEQCMAAALPACAAPELKLPAYSGMSASTAAAASGFVLPPAQALASPACPSYSSMSSGMVNAAAGMQLAATAGSGSCLAAPQKPGSRRQRSQAEVEAAVERIKEKRRQSAQRSRARKNDYMRQLEFENQSLKDEVTRLQQLLAQMQRGAACLQPHQVSAVMM